MPGRRGRSAIPGRFGKQSEVKWNPKSPTTEISGKARNKKRP